MSNLTWEFVKLSIKDNKYPCYLIHKIRDSEHTKKYKCTKEAKNAEDTIEFVTANKEKLEMKGKQAGKVWIISYAKSCKEFKF